MSVEVLPSARERSARDNLAEYVRYARKDIAAYGAELVFDDVMWDVTASHMTRASSGHQKAKLYFTTHAGGSSKSHEGRISLEEPFASFIKAAVRRKQDSAPVNASIQAVMIRAARYLYDALAAKTHDPCLLVADDFTAAAQTCRQRETEASRYRVGIHLAYLAEQVDRYGLAAVRIDWVNPFRRVATDSRIGKAAEARRSCKLPSDDVLDAIAQLGEKVNTDADLLRLRVIELLVCGGWRINELLTIPADCEVTDVATGADGRFQERYGIRYFAEKMGGPTVKWLPSPMVDVAKRAIGEVRRITADARKVAAWMASNPGRAWLPDWARSRPSLTSKELADALGMPDSGSARAFMAANSFFVRGDGTFSVGDIESVILARQPRFAGMRLPWSFHEQLFLMPWNWCHGSKAILPPIVNIVRDQQISDFITGREGSPSVFERFGFIGKDGTALRVTSHQFRHWLNTLAQRGGMGQMEIARWSGRKDVGQNSAYDHVTGVELAERVRKRMEDGQIHGPIARTAAAMDPVSRAEFVASRLTTAHLTDLGMCLNDWAMTPCVWHAACADCSENMVVKGRADHRDRAVKLKSETEELLTFALDEAAEGSYGASNFVAHHSRVRDALSLIIAVHDDPAIPDGDLVQIALTRALEGPLEKGKSHAP